jgi:hypothetical protein
MTPRPRDRAGSLGKRHPGAERAVRFRVSEALEFAEGTKLGSRLTERLPFNPPAQRGPQALTSLTHDRPG